MNASVKNETSPSNVDYGLCHVYPLLVVFHQTTSRRRCVQWPTGEAELRTLLPYLSAEWPRPWSSPTNRLLIWQNRSSSDPLHQVGAMACRFFLFLFVHLSTVPRYNFQPFFALVFFLLISFFFFFAFLLKKKIYFLIF